MPADQFAVLLLPAFYRDNRRVAILRTAFARRPAGERSRDADSDCFSGGDHDRDIRATHDGINDYGRCVLVIAVTTCRDE